MTIDASEERVRRARAREGAVLRDKWQLDRLLGVGGMASVFSATHRNNGKRVAVKMLHPELSVVSQIKARFLREGYASNQVGHHGVVSVLDDDVSEDGSVFLVMELLEGENLDQRRLAAGGSLNLLEVLWAMDQLLDVLTAAHAKGIIHRDIKPENLFLTREATLKVLDFGLARVQRPQQAQGLTRTNMLMGTLDFMSPEQARGKWDGVGAQADLWSVGATMFMLLSGRPVHEEATLDTQLKAVASRPPRSLRAVRPDLPSAVVSLVDRALAFNAHDRWPDAATMQEAVRQAYVVAGGGDDGGTLRPPPAVDPTTAPPPAADPPGGGSPSFESRVTRAWDAHRPDSGVTQALTGDDVLPESEDEPDAPTQALRDLDLDPLAIPPPPRLPSVPSVDPAAPGPTPQPLSSTGANPVALLSSTGASPAAPPSLTETTPKRAMLLALASLPLWLLLFWGVTRLRAPAATEPDAPASASVAPDASAPPSAEPALSAASPPASASAETPTPPPSASAPPASTSKRPPPTNRPRGGPTPLPRPPTKKR